MTRPTLAVEVQNACNCTSVPEPQKIESWVRFALGEAARGELTARVVGEREGADLNRRYRGREGPTNVLAFAADKAVPDLGGELPPLGDLVLCAAVIEREAQQQGEALEAHWAHVVIHGALHLLGYDHETPRETEAMEARERELLAALGFADPYS